MPTFAQSIPDFLQGNLALAAAIAGDILQSRSLDLRRALTKMTEEDLPACLNARFELRTLRLNGRSFPITFDAGRNPEGLAALGKAVSATGGEVHGIFSMLRDKDIRSGIQLAESFTKSLRLFRCQSERSWSESQTAGRHLFPDVKESILDALENESFATDRPEFLVFGSVFAVGESLRDLTPYLDP